MGLTSPMLFVRFLSLIHISEPTRPLYISYAVFCFAIFCASYIDCSCGSIPLIEDWENCSAIIVVEWPKPHPISAKLPPLVRVLTAPPILGSHLLIRNIEYAGLKKRAEPDKQHGWSEPHSVPSPDLKFCLIRSVSYTHLTLPTNREV